MSNCHTSYVGSGKYIEDGYFPPDYIEPVPAQTVEELILEYGHRHNVHLPDIVPASAQDVVFDTDLDDCVGIHTNVGGSGIVRVLLSSDSSSVDVYVNEINPLRLSVLRVLSVGTTATGLVSLHYP